MDDHVASVLEDAFPDRDVARVNPSGPSWNEKNRTVGVDFADEQTIYVKMATDGDGTRIARERAAIAYVDANCDVPVPTVLASDTDGDVPYLATDAVSGQNLLSVWSDASVTERAETARRVGESFARVHARRFDAHGHVVGGDEQDLELDTASWTDVLVDRIEAWRDLATSDRFDHHFDEVIAAVEAKRDRLDDAPAALLHGDPAHPNCYLDGDRVGFLDWELVYAGDPVRDLRRAHRIQFEPTRAEAPEEVVTALYDGYREQAGGLPDGFETRTPLYDAVAFLGTSGYVDKYAEFLDESEEELADWIRAEMERRLAEI